MSDRPRLSVIVHDNDEVTVRDERGIPVLCSDCRFAGWINKTEFDREKDPVTCLFHSGGANPVRGGRVLLPKDEKYDFQFERTWWRQKYPLGGTKNLNGQCPDFVRAKPIVRSWWRRLLRLGPSRSERRKMRE